MRIGSEISIAIDQTLTEDPLGTIAYLQFEAMGIPKVRTKLSVSYVDHCMLQEGFEHSDDHRYLQTVAEKYGILFSKPGNGICHQVHLERFSRPGETLIGADSHTPMCGAVAMLAIGAGGLDVAVAMAGGEFYLTYPKVVRINLQGRLRPWSTAKDIILAILKKMTTKGNVGKAIEYGGAGMKTLTVPGAIDASPTWGPSSASPLPYFPATKSPGSSSRPRDVRPTGANSCPTRTPAMTKSIDIDLDRIEPNVALPHSPDNVSTVARSGADRSPSGDDRQLHKFILSGSHGRCPNAEGQTGSSRREFRGGGGQPAGIENDRGKWRAE